MESAQILDGKVLAAKLRSKVNSDISELQASVPRFQPHLSIVQVTKLQAPSAHTRAAHTPCLGYLNYFPAVYN